MLDRFLGPDRRAEPRQPAACEVTLLRDGRAVGRAQLKDLSPGGARLMGVHDAIAGAHAFVLPDQGEVCSYEVLRSGFGGVGVRITARRTLKAGERRRA